MATLTDDRREIKGVIDMIKFTYTAEPFYSGLCGINEPCTKDLTITFDNDASSTEIINELVRLLKYAGYSYIDRKSALISAIDDMVDDGVVFDDIERRTE